MPTLLVLAGGRRRYVIEALQRSAPSGARLIVADADPRAVALTVPMIDVRIEPQQRLEADSWLLDLCRVECVDAVLSLHDYQIARVAELAPQLRASGTRYIGPSASTARLLLDKIRTFEHVQNAAATAAVATLPAGEVTTAEFGSVAQWILKDRYGSGSSGLFRVDTYDKFHAVVQLAQAMGWELVAQPALQGQEYNVDLFVDQDGMVMGHCVKRKLAMRAGETDIAEVIVDNPIAEKAVRTCRRILRDLDLQGNVDVDVFVSGGGDVQVIDVNPRFGGGYAFSAAAGYHAARGVWELTSRHPVTPLSPPHALIAAKGVAVHRISSSAAHGTAGRGT